MATTQIDPARSFQQGIRSCREGNWRDGHNELTRLALQEEGRGQLPGLFYGYLGQAMARCEGRRREGLDLCLHAVEIDPFKPENYLNLAEVYVLLRNKRGALRAMDQGLRIDPTYERLLEFGRSLGLRRRPPVPFLDRGHVVNRGLGQLTSRIQRAWRAARYPRDDDGDDFWVKPC